MHTTAMHSDWRQGRLVRDAGSVTDYSEVRSAMKSFTQKPLGYAGAGGSRVTYNEYGERAETLASRREKLSQKQKSWKQDFENDPDMFAVYGSALDLSTTPSPLELSMLYQSLLTPGLAKDANATPKQLIQLLHSPDPKIGLFALKRIASLMEAGEMDLTHLSTAIKPMVSIVLNGDLRDELYWAVLYVLQQLCLDDRHAMAVGDHGGTRALIRLIDVNHEPTPEYESVNHNVITNILNAIWLICCYEGNGDLSAYKEEEGPIVSIVGLLRSLREEGNAMRDSPGALQAQKLMKRDFMGVEPAEDEPAADDPVFVLLCALDKLSNLKAYRGQITAAGGIEECVPLLSHPRQENRVTSCRLLRNLMVNNSLEFVILGGLMGLTTLLASPNEAEHWAALRLALHLFNIRGDLRSMTSDLVGCGCLVVCASLLQNQNRAVSRAALSLLTLLCKNGSEDYSYLLSQEEGMVQGTISLLRDTHLPTLQQATAMFWYLTRVFCDGTPASSLVLSSIPLLKRLLNSTSDPIVHHNVIGALSKIECFDDLTDDMFATSPARNPTIHW